VRRLIVLVSVAAMTLLGVVAIGGSAQAKVPGPNGQIVFARFDPALESTVTYTVNPDGSHQQQLFPRGAENPRWSPDGSEVSIFCCDDGMAAHLVDPDTGSFRELAPPDPTLEVHCGPWSADGARLACESFGVTDPSRNGVYAIRSSDGGGLTRITSNPDGGDIPGDYSPDGKQLLFGRMDPTRPAKANVALFVINLDGTGLLRITPWGLPGLCFCGSWSPDGATILFGGSSFGKRGGSSSLYVVHPDGTGLATVPLATGGLSRAFDPGWSPDGTKIVFGLFTKTSPGTEQEGIYTANADGSDVQPVTGSPTFDGTPDWGPHPLAT
jgi:Tol biopolymer transport system component